MADLARDKNVIGVAYTYSEPSIWFEYVLKTSQVVKSNGMKNVLVTNGFINKKPLKELIPYIDGINIDLKAYNPDFYQRICGGKLKPVLENIKYLRDKVHIEITTLLIPGLNDSTEELEDMFQWLNSLDPDIPLHITRYFPRYRLNLPPTSIDELKEAYDLAKRYLNYVYLGNINLDQGRDTVCPHCGQVVIERNIRVINRIKDGRCPWCGQEIKGEFRNK